MGYIKRISLFIIFFTIITVFIGAVSANNWTVNPGDSIQATINNASVNDTINVNDNDSNYTYTENLIINKTLTLKTTGNVTIITPNPSISTIIINSGGNGSTIQGFIIKGATGTGKSGICLDGASNCIIRTNTITDNYIGINIFSNNNTIELNNITNNSWMGINLSYLTNNLVQNNSIYNNTWYGIHLGESNNITIISNSISYSVYGINPQISNANIYFNRIVQCSKFGLVNQDSTVNATNNWWGTNDPYYVNSPNWPATADIYVESGSVISNPHLNLIISTSYENIPRNVSRNVTADLTRNNNGIDTSLSGNIIDNIPINFNTTLGTITTPAFTKNGKTVTNFNSGTISGLVTIYAILDKQTVSKTLNIIGIYNNRTLMGYVSLQTAINDALDGDTIWLENGIYTENIIVNKSLTIKARENHNVTIQALNPTNHVITVRSHGTKIEGLTVKGANNAIGILLDSNASIRSSNCTVKNNYVTNNYYGIYSLGNNNTITNNTVINNNWMAIILIDATNNLIKNNTLLNNNYGIYLRNSNNITIKNNNIAGGGMYGINPQSSTANINFNKITGCTVFGIVNQVNSVINATNNWWGTNNPTISTNAGNDICVQSGTLNYDPWIVMNLAGSTIHVTKNNLSSSEITADVTFNNHGENTSSSDTIPDGLPVNFTTTIGTITPIATTKNGKATVILSSSPSSSVTTVSATLNNQQVSKAFHKSFSTIQSAIDSPLTVDGDTILVENGSYTENILIFKSLTIISEVDVNIIPSNSSQPAFTVYYFSSTIQGFNIKGSTSYGILLFEANDCNITGNFITNSSGGIYVYISNNTRITGNNITNNTENGIYIDNSNENLIFQNNITHNGHNGIYTNYSNNNTLSGNNASFNGLNGISLGYANNNTLSGNNATNNTNHGIYFYQTNNNSASINNATNNAFSGICIGNSNNTTLIGNNATDNDQVGIFLAYSNSTLISGSNVRNNGMNGTLYGGIIVNYSSNITISANNVTNNTENGILLYNTNRTTISGNNAISNIYGITLQNASYITISVNNATDNILNGIILLYSSNNTISGNNIKNNHNVGIYVDNSDSTKITKNTITNNQKGIYLYFSPATVNFNRIAENTLGGLFNEFSNFVNTTNNWWGSNNPTVSSSNSSDICILGGNVVYSPWIVLGVNSIRVSDGISNITADLTYNNEGTDTLSLGHVPDGITVNFTTDLGTIQQTGLTINGKATSQLNYTVPHNTVNVTATLDNQAISKTVNLFKVYNTVTQEGFTTIQAAINDSSTSNGDIIEVANGIYNENIVLNKSLTLTAANGSSPIINGSITINSGGSNSIIQGFTVKGIYINSSNNNTISNSIISNQTGVSIYNSNYNKILNNTISQNTGNGISIQLGYNNILSGNEITYNTDGISINRSYNNTVYSNTISNNTGCGINIFDYSGYANYINFNKIVGNGLYGLYVEEGLINATHNWWGTNNLTESLCGPSDIAIEFGTVYYDPYLVLNVTANPTATDNNSTITADFTHDNNGNDTFPQGHIPNGIPVNFTTNLGTITSPAYTKNGKAILTFKTGTTTSGMANITTTVDRQSIQLNINVDTIAPTVNATLDSGLYTTTQYVNLTAGDNLDLHPIIYYTTNGSTPTVSSTIYAAPIVITTTTTLKFMAVDFTGNQSPVGTLYYIFASVGNLNMGIGYSSIQNAINDNLTLDGHVIIVGNGTYTENILVNKNLTLIPYDGNVTIHAANPNNPVITINSGGSESVISGFTLIGATGTSSSGIYLNQGSNCTIVGNTLTNNYYGLLLTSSQDNMIWDNNLTGNLMDAVQLNNSNNNTIYSNTIINNTGQGVSLTNSSYTLVMANTIQDNLMNGIELNTSNNATIYENTITTNHQSGIKATSSSASINFNIIAENTVYGLYNLGNSMVNATNNWWGNNNLTVSSTNGSAIYSTGGNVTRDVWLVMHLTGSLIHVTHDTNSSSEITADITHNNHGEDTSSSGAIPDGLPIQFNSILGSITPTASTRRGLATVTLTSSPNSNATIVTASQGNFSVSKLFRKSFTTIQGAVNDSLTVNGDIILVSNGTYTENVVINKNLTVISEGNVTVQALNSSQPVFTVSNCGNVIIYGFTIIGAVNSSAIYLNGVNNSQILSNNITGNGLQLVNNTSVGGYGIFLNSTINSTIAGNNLLHNAGGIKLTNSNNNQLSENNITNSPWKGIYLNQSPNTQISENNLANNSYGIFAEYSNNLKVTGNDIINNTYQGIFLNCSSGELHFNRIVGNGEYGLLSNNSSSSVNATNNWWGTNNPTVSSAKPSDIYYIGQPVIYNPRLILTVTPTSYKVVDGKVYEATITADLNHNSAGEDLSTVVYVPDGIPVNFTSNNGSNITSTIYTVKGESKAILNLTSTQSGVVLVTATVDRFSSYTTVDKIAQASIVVFSTTALNVNNPTQNLYLTYNVPLNESVSWVSVLWKSTSSDFGSFTNEVDLIVNGVVVRSQTVINPYYYYNKNNYSDKVWYSVNFLNWLFSGSSESEMALKSYMERYPGLQNLTGTVLETGILNITQQINGFNSSEMNVIAHHNYFKDNIRTYIAYHGDAAKKISFEDPDTNQTTGLTFSGNPIYRESTMIYANGGYYHTYGDDPLNPTSILYKDAGYEGVRSFAIVTTRVTDEILQYWLDQKDKTDSNGTHLYANGPMKAAYGTFLTSLMMIKCHDMIADQAAVQYNIIWARTTPIVVSVFDDAYRTVMTLECDHRFGMDVTGDVNNITAFRYACSSAINPLEHYVMKTLFPGGNGTSIVMGLGMELFNGQMPGIFISNGYMVMRSVDNGLFLIFDPETGILRDIMLLNSTISGEYCFSDLQAEWVSDLGERLLNNPPVWLGLIGSTVTVGGSSFLGIGRVLANPVVLTVALGLVTGYAIFQYCVDQGWLPPERCREIIGISPPFAILNKLLYNEEPLFELNKLNKEEAVIYGPILKKRLSDVTAGQVPLDGPKGDKAAFLRNLYNEAIGWIKDGISDISAGNSATGTAKIALYSTGAAKITVGTGGIYFWGSYFAMELLPDKAKEQILKLIS